MLNRVVILLLLVLPPGQAAERTGAAVTVHPLATKAAQKVFQQGGNAVDATVAAALTLGVVDGFNSGIGGGCFMLIRKPDGTFSAIDGRETAPAAASRDMYLRGGKANPELSRTGLVRWPRTILRSVNTATSPSPSTLAKRQRSPSKGSLSTIRTCTG